MFTTLRDLGGVLISLISISIVVVATVRAFMTKDRPSHLHIALHFTRCGRDGKRWLKFPTMSRMILPEIYDYITSTWLLFAAPYWARSHNFSPVLMLPDKSGACWWRRKVLCCCPSLDGIINPLRRYLSEHHAEAWVERAKSRRVLRWDRISSGKMEGAVLLTARERTTAHSREKVFVLALVYEPGSTSLRAVLIKRSLLEKIAKNPDHIESMPHPLYDDSPVRPETIRTLARAYTEWKKNPSTSNLAIALLEL